MYIAFSYTLSSSISIVYFTISSILSLLGRGLGSRGLTSIVLTYTFIYSYYYSFTKGNRLISYFLLSKEDNLQVSITQPSSSSLFTRLSNNLYIKLNSRVLISLGLFISRLEGQYRDTRVFSIYSTSLIRISLYIYNLVGINTSC